MLPVTTVSHNQLKSADDIKHWVKTLKHIEIPTGLILMEPFDFVIAPISDITQKHQNFEDTSVLLSEIRDLFSQLITDLLDDDENSLTDFNDNFIEMEWTLEDPPENDALFVKDQLLTVVAILSSKIIAAYLEKENIPNTWLDARDFMVADNNYGNGKILQIESLKKCNTLWNHLKSDKSLLITQGGIACTTENFNITLGKNGSKVMADFIISLLK